MTEHLTALDATFLELEQADESAHMHIGGIMLFEGEPPSHEEFCEGLAERLHVLPRYRQRLSEPRTGGMGWPEWLEDAKFDVRRHVTRAALPAPGGERELQNWVSEFFSRRLDRGRPLWEMVMLEGLDGGGWALATKTHHCMVDGVGSIDVGHLLLDTSPERTRWSEDEHRAAGAPEQPESPPAGSGIPLVGAIGRLGRAWGSLVPFESIRGAVQMSTHGVMHPRDALHSAMAAAEMIVRDELRAAPQVSFNERMGVRRRFEVVRVPLDDMRAIKNALGGTINDVALTISASGLRALLLSRGESLPDAGLRAMVPMNIRLASEHLALGNKVSMLFIDLPVADADLLARYRETSAHSSALKQDGVAADGTTAVIELAGLAPPVLHASVAQALFAKRLFNVTVTNVPGPQQTLYAHGSALREIHPLVPLAAEHAVGVAILSYDGIAFFGVVADPDAVPDLDVMLDGMRACAGELLAATTTHA